ncbi:MAG: hypothetical protein RKR03_04490 [Candidatus Competibacter sp.]|nr:hypothetical protein [Candidatus Competibacter sp.]
MMAAAWTALALLLPWLCGALWIRGCWRDSAVAGFWPMALGYGYVLGILAATLLLRVMDAVGIRLNFVCPATLMVVAAVVAAVGAWRGRTMPGRELVGGGNGEGPPGWQRLLWVLLVVWLAARLAVLALEVFWLPLYPWDAWSTWMVRPRAWLEFRRLVPFQDAGAWLGDPTGLVYHIEAWRYPLTVSLIALWTALASGQWLESSINLSWLCCGLALGLGCYGQARIWGATPLQGLIFVWLVLSLPLLDVHIALAGYADLWLATVFGMSAIAFMQWIRFQDRRQGILAVVLASFCPFIKQEGLVWLLLFLPPLLVTWLPRRYLLGLIGIIATFLGFWLFLGSGAFHVPGLGDFRITLETIQIPGLGQFHLMYWNNWGSVMENLLILDNWHLLGYLLLVAVGGIVLLRKKERGDLRVTTLFVLSMLLAVFGLFFLTEAGRWAEDFTSVNRIILHFVPALLFWTMTVFVQPRSRAPQDQG